VPYQEPVKFGNHFGGTKKKSDDFIKKRLEQKSEAKKEAILPKHAIKPPELADKSFVLPKIPIKNQTASPPSIQLSIAEIVEEADKEHGKVLEELDEETELVVETVSQSLVPDFNMENIGKAFALFADKQKVSIVSLIKLLIPALEGDVVIVTMTRQQEEFIGDIKIQWQAFLRNHFKNNSIILQIKIDEQAETHRKAYTPSEQFQEMLNENETFRQLVTRLKLKLK
jgi:hypothetical protein